MHAERRIRPSVLYVHVSILVEWPFRLLWSSVKEGTITMVSVQLPLLIGPRLSQDSHGAVYTRPWVVNLILDLASYVESVDLGGMIAIEPAVGDGAFVGAMVERLVESCRRHGRDIISCRSALRGFDLDPRSVEVSRKVAVEVLVRAGVSAADATELAAGWITEGNYLFEAPTLPSADFVIGNPPYIRLEDIGDEISSAYRSIYRTMKGRADIYVGFYEAALRQLKANGVCAYICADRWMLNQYGSSLRSLVTASFSVDAIIEMHTANAFESDVSAYPAITVIRKQPQGPVVVARATEHASDAEPSELFTALESVRLGQATSDFPQGLRAFKVETWFSGTDPWPYTSPERLQVLRRLEDKFRPLESEETGTKVGIGVATGCDDVFITTDPELVEPERLLPLALGSDTLNGSLQWSGHYLVNPWNEHGLVELSEYPRLAAYFERNRHRLERRHVAVRQPAHWYRTIDRVTHSLTHRPKLYIPDIKNRIHPVLDRGTTYPHHNLYVIYSDSWDLEVLGGLLLSDVGQFFVECYGVRMRGGWLRFQAQYLRRIRVPNPKEITPEQSRELADAFRRHDRVAATRIALDVYKLDGLPMRDGEADAGSP